MTAPALVAPVIPIKLPAKLVPILEPKRFKILYGGRGGAKSHTIAQVLLAMGLRRRMRILCCREVQKSLAESSMQVLKDYIERLGLSAYYTVLKNEIRGCNGTTFSFTGLKEHTKDSIKSFEGVDIVWVEEAHSVSKASWEVLIPTIRKDDSEIWASFNPDQETDYVYDRFVKNTDPDAWVVKVDWRDNPWFGQVMDAERRKMQALNDDLYQHVWEGKCRSAAGILFKRAWFRTYDRLPAKLHYFMASDYAATDLEEAEPGQEPDWTEHGVWALDSDGNLYAVDWWSGQTDPSVWIQTALALARKYTLMRWFEEGGGIRRALQGTITKAIRDASPPVRVVREALPSATDKASRALGFAAMCASGNVYFPKDKPWASRLIEQLCAFTGQDGKTDDMVDVCSLVARGIDLIPNARPEAAKKPDPPKPFTDEWFAQRDRDEAPEGKAKFYR